jgi:hypothetical protein
MTRVTLALLFLASPLLGLAWCALSALEDRRPARAIAWAARSASTWRCWPWAPGA